MADFLAYQAYPNPEIAQDLLALLDEQHILYKADYAPARFNAVFGATTAEQFVVSLRPEDFTRVRQLEEERAATSLAELPADYYLFDFTNSELWNLLSKPDAWSSHDVALASRLLRERGKTVTEKTLQTLRTQQNANLAAPSPSPRVLIVAGYAFALMGGLIGMGIGWSIMRFRKTLPDGRQVSAYAKRDQQHGQRILVLSAVSFLFWVLFPLLHR